MIPGATREKVGVSTPKQSSTGSTLPRSLSCGRAESTASHESQKTETTSSTEEQTIHRVSLKIEWTMEQLGKAMGALLNIGLPVSVKVEV